MVAGTGKAASSGDGGAATAAAVFEPVGMVLDIEGNLYFTERNGNKIRRVDEETGIITTVVGTGGKASTGDGGPAAQATLNGPHGLAMDPLGNLFVACLVGSRIRRIGQPVDLTNLAPWPRAGPDLAATPGTPLRLEGDRTSDPEDDAPIPKWSLVSGPSLAITSATTLVAGITPTVPSTYEFLLTVEDGRGGERDDRMRLEVLPGDPLAVLYEDDRLGSLDVWRMAMNGVGSQPLTQDSAQDHTPRWSPDRERIAFISDRGGQPRVWVMGKDGSSPTRVEDDGGTAREGLAWHPDGQHVLYGTGTEYRLASVAGTEGTTTFASFAGHVPRGGLDWYPDGSAAVLGFAPSGDLSTVTIYRASADGSGLTTFIDRAGASDESPAVSPDGTRVLFESTPGGGKPDLWMASASTGTITTRVTSSPAVTEKHPRWYPDGSRILFVSDIDGDLDVHSTRPDGTTTITLTFNLFVDGHPDVGLSLAPNYPPVARASPPPAAPRLAEIVLDGSTSYDPNGEALTYLWEIVSAPGAASLDGTSSTTSATTTLVGQQAGPHQVRLTVTDWRGRSTSKTVAVTVTPSDVDPPTATLTYSAASPVRLPAAVTVTVVFSEPLAETPTIEWRRISGTGTLAGGSLAPSGATSTYTFTFQADTSSNGLWLPNLQARDLSGNALTQQPEDAAFTIDVRANTAPVANAGPGQVVEAGSFVVLDGTGTSDSEGDPITYAWLVDSGPSAVSLANDDTPSPAFVAGAVGTYVLRLRATDDRFASTEDTVRVTATEPLPDLFVEAVQAPVTAIVGEDITLGASVKNRGKATSTAPFVTEFFLSEDTTLEVLRDRKLGSAPPVQRMDPNQRLNVVASGLLVPLDLPPASYHVIARADPTDTVLERDETNNSLASTLPTSVAPTLPDDHPNFASATDGDDTVAVDGTPLEGRIGQPGDADFFRFTAAAGTEYILETVVQDTDTVLTLYDRDRTTSLLSNDDAALGSLFSRLTFTPFFAGTYYLQVVHASAQGTGSYAVKVTPKAQAVVDDHPDFSSLTGTGDTLAPGVSVTGSLETSGDVDVFRFEGEVGHAYDIRASSQQVPFYEMNLVDLDGTRILVAQLGDGDAPAEVRTFRPRTAGFYFVQVSAAPPERAGDYEVRVTAREEVLGDPPAVRVVETASPGQLDAVLRTEGTSVPVSSLQLLVEYPRGELKFRDPTYGPAASAFNPSVNEFLPPFLPVKFLTQTPTPMGQGDLVTLAFEAGDDAPAPGRVTVLSATATDPRTQVTVLRPTADAGVDREVVTTGPGGSGPAIRDPLEPSGPRVDFVRLDGRLSRDPNTPARTLTYRWSQTGGPGTVSLSDPASPVPTFVPPVAGEYAFELVVDNGVLASPPSVVRVSVNRAGRAPAAVAQIVEVATGREAEGGDLPLGVTQGVTIRLDGTGSSDPDPAERDSLAFSWRQRAGPAVTLSSATSSVATFTAGSVGTYRFELAVTDPRGLRSVSLPVAVAARGAEGTPPVLSVFASASTTGAFGRDLGEVPGLSGEAPLRVEVPTSVTLTALVEDPDVGLPPLFEKLSFFWRQLEGPAVELTQEGGEEVSGLRSLVSFSPRQAGLYVFETTVRELSRSGEATGHEVTRRIRVAVDTAAERVPEARASVGVVAVAGKGKKGKGEWEWGMASSGGSQDAVDRSGGQAPKSPQRLVVTDDSGAGISEPVPGVGLPRTRSRGGGISVAAPGMSFHKHGGDVAVVPGTGLVLDGRASSVGGGSDGGLAYRWVQTAGPVVQLSDPFAPVTTFTAPDLGEGTAHQMVFQLFTDDGTSRGAPARAVVDVAHPTPVTTAEPEPPPPDDHPDSAAATDPSSAVAGDGTPVAGVLDRAEDVDVFRTILSAGTLYLLETQVSGQADTVLALLDTDGTSVLATNDNAGLGDRASRIAFTPPAAGTYYLSVTAADGDHLGPYTLSVRPTQGAIVDDHPDSPGDVTAADVLTAGTPVTGRFEASSDLDVFGFPARVDRLYDITVSTTSVVSLDLILNGPEGTAVLERASGGTGTPATLTGIRPERPGTHFVQVAPGIPRRAGPYEVLVSERTETLSNPPSLTMTSLLAADRLVATIHTEGTTLPVSRLTLSLSFDVTHLSFQDTQFGPSTSGFSSGVESVRPPFLTLELQSTPPRRIQPGQLATLRFVSLVPSGTERTDPGLLSVTATDPSTSVSVLRPAADAGSPMEALLRTGGSRPSILNATDPLDPSAPPLPFIRLDGRLSRDPNRPPRPLTYLWIQSAGPRTVTLSSPSGPHPTFTVDAAGTYSFELVTDNGILESLPVFTTVSVREQASTTPTPPTTSTSGTPRVTEPSSVPPAPIVTAQIQLSRGLNLISLPLVPAGAGGQPYGAHDLARHMSASVVVRTREGPAGRARFAPWIPGPDASNWPVLGRSGYLVIHPSSPSTLSMTGTTWPATSATLVIPPGVNLVGLPFPPGSGADTTVLTTQASAGIAFIAIPANGTPGRLRWRIHLPGLTSPLPLTPGRGLLVSSPAGGTLALPR